METLKDPRVRFSPDKCIVVCNHILKDLYGRIDCETNRDFGINMLHRNGSNVSDITIAYRILKKFQEPAKGQKQKLRSDCFSTWVEHERQIESFDFDAIPAESKSVLYKARGMLHSWFRDFKPNRDVVEFTPGETFWSNHGRVSVYQKLKNKEAWCVTHDALEDFIRLCYNNLSLKRCAKALMPKLTRKQHRALYAAALKTGRHVGYTCFHHMMEHFVVTVVHGSRASSVDKNNSEDRFINVEPLGNMILQRQVATPMRDILRGVGNDLELGQLLHQVRIALKGLSTIDFSKASDSVLLAVVLKLFPANVTKFLLRYRSPFVLIDGVYYMPKKLSSMGCGFTFEVMSALILAIARVYDAGATVYGDDVIIASQPADAFVKVMDDVKMKVNQKKTFIDAPFRESCGSYYWDEVGYIRCFDLHWLKNMNDVLIATNKLYFITAHNPDSSVVRECGVAYEALLSQIPASMRGYEPTVYSGPDLGYAIDRQARKKHMRSAEVARCRERNQKYLDHVAAKFCVKATDILIVDTPKFVSTLASPYTPHVPDQSALYSSYLYSGRRAQDVVRNTGKWVSKLKLIHHHFEMYLSEAKKLYTDNVSWETAGYFAYNRKHKVQMGGNPQSDLH